MIQTKKILIVDDEQHVRQLLSKVLRKEGYEIFTAADGLDGLQVFQNNNIDVIISDIKMPGMDGIEFLHEVKAQQPDVGFILITAFATMETAIDAIKSGAQDYVTKPFDISEIVNAVKKIVASREAESESAFKGSELEQIRVSSKSPAMQEVITLARRVAQSDATVLVLGETGTGKEVISTAIHNWSRRKDNPIIKVNCGAIPDNLLESELFGYEKGAFTGAATTKPGRFEFADGGTIFLDEIGDISPSIQVKLLRVLQEKTFERLGGVRTIKADVRVIAATNKDLKEAVQKGEFREDLYYRLNVVPIRLVPLRERKEDIDDLVEYFLHSAAEISGSSRPKKVSEAAMERLRNYYWPGNIRELENIIERCVVITPDDVIGEDSLPAEILSYRGENVPEEDGAKGTKELLNEAIDDKEKEVIIKVLRENNGNKTKSALALGISRRSLHRKIQKYGITD
ncbi:MAG: sigma-54-dependent transcriptional regulator [Lentihominibacter sp.]